MPKLGTSYIHLIPGLRASNSYLIAGPQSNDLVDCGLPGSSKKIIQYIESMGINDPLSTLYLTHPDPDHSGSAYELKQHFPELKVAIHEADAPRLSGKKKLKELKGAIGIAMDIVSTFAKFHPIEPDILLKDGEVLGNLKTIYTPGHTEGSICLYDEKQSAMFVGDTLRTNSSGNIDLVTASMSYDIDKLKDSVSTKLTGIKFELFLPGHGQPIEHRGSEKLKEIISKIEREKR